MKKVLLLFAVLSCSVLFTSCEFFLAKIYDFNFVVKGDIDGDGENEVLPDITVIYKGFYDIVSATTDENGKASFNDLKLSLHYDTADFSFDDMDKKYNDQFESGGIIIVLNDEKDLSSYTLWPAEYYEEGKTYEVILERKTMKE